MQTLEGLKRILKAFKARVTVVRRVVIIHEPNDQRRDKIERRLEELGYEIEHVDCDCIYVNMRKSRGR